MQNQVMLITGASSGIGAALAQELSRRGARVSLAARNADRLHEVAATCPGETLVIPTDVSDPAQCEAAIQQTVERFGGLHVLVNNAGVSMWSPFEDVQDISIFEQMMQVNYLGSVYCTRAALPHLKATGGLIVAISSLAGKTGIPFRTGYAASKHAMQGFFDALRIELAGSGVDVSVISPGFVDTPVRENSFSASGTRLGKDPNKQDAGMTAESCARIIADAIEKRPRELLMGWKGKLLMLGRLLAPGLVDRMARKSARWDEYQRRA